MDTKQNKQTLILCIYVRIKMLYVRKISRWTSNLSVHLEYPHRTCRPDSNYILTKNWIIWTCPGPNIAFLNEENSTMWHIKWLRSVPRHSALHGTRCGTTQTDLILTRTIKIAKECKRTITSRLMCRISVANLNLPHFSVQVQLQQFWPNFTLAAS